MLVAECLSFRRAAKVLGIRQSSVSRSVRALEDTLGVSLFERSPAGVRVTSAGADFFKETRYAIARIDWAVHVAATAGQGAVGSLAIGISSSLSSGFLRKAIGIYRERHPGVALNVLEGTLSTQLALIGTHRLDVSFVSASLPPSNYEAAPLWSERLFIALPRAHVLCDREEVNWDALTGERILFCKDDALHDELSDRFPSVGKGSSVQKLDAHRETLLHLIALGLGVSLTSESTISTQFPEIVFRPVAGNQATVLYSAVWSSTNDNPAFRRFLSLARTLAKQRLSQE